MLESDAHGLFAFVIAEGVDLAGVPFSFLSRGVSVIGIAKPFVLGLQASKGLSVVAVADSTVVPFSGWWIKGVAGVQRTLWHGDTLRSRGAGHRSGPDCVWPCSS